MLFRSVPESLSSRGENALTVPAPINLQTELTTTHVLPFWVEVTTMKLLRQFILATVLLLACALVRAEPSGENEQSRFSEAERACARLLKDRPAPAFVRGRDAPGSDNRRDAESRNGKSKIPLGGQTFRHPSAVN
mgnify:CR=1 FL=1